MVRPVRYVFLLLLGLVLSGVATGQVNHSAIQEVVDGIRTSRVEDISKYFDKYVPININNNSANFSHNQARQVLKDFFEKNPPHDLYVSNSGSNSETSRFAIGSYSCPAGRYVFYVLMQARDKSFVIKELRFTKD